jgi:hypothetical protein
MTCPDGAETAEGKELQNSIRHKRKVHERCDTLLTQAVNDGEWQPKSRLYTVNADRVARIQPMPEDGIPLLGGPSSGTDLLCWVIKGSVNTLWFFHAMTLMTTN